MTTTIDCPICLDCIESTTKNCVTTECGHCFHTNCLMQSVAHNGFGCPYCRTLMAAAKEKDEESLSSQEEDDDDESEYDDDDDDNDDDESLDRFMRFYPNVQEEEALRSFRFFWNIQEEDDDENFWNIQEEDDDNQEIEELGDRIIARENERIHRNIPSTVFVAQKLCEQGITFEMLVDMMCHLDHEEYEDDERAEEFNDYIFGKIRIIVSNYRPEQAMPSVEQAMPPVEQAMPPVEQAIPPVEQAIPEVDFAAQPKTTHVRVPRFISHV